MINSKVIQENLTISRDDVPWDHLVDYPVRDRFFKLPVEAFFEMAGVFPIESQIAIINALNNPKYRFITACLSRRQGKTFVANHLAFLLCLIPDVKVLVISPNYNLSSISWEEQHKLVKHFNIDLVRDNAKDRSMIFPNGSELRLASVAQADSAVGRSYDLILFDEAALNDKGKDAFNVRLRPTLDKINSKAIFISTPRGRNWFREFYDRGFSNKKAYSKWCSIHAPWKCNPRIDIADIEEAQATMSKAEFEQEFCASFSVFEGQVFNLPTKNVRDLSAMDWSAIDYETVMGIDVGFRDATAATVFRRDVDTEIWYCVEEYKLNETTTSQHATNIKELEEKWDIDVIYVDAANAQTMHDWAMDYDISSFPAKKSILDGINKVTTLVEHGKLIVDMNCTDLIWSFDQYRWAEKDKAEKVLGTGNSKEASHLLDSLRYAIYSHR